MEKINLNKTNSKKSFNELKSFCEKELGKKVNDFETSKEDWGARIGSESFQTSLNKKT